MSYLWDEALLVTLLTAPELEGEESDVRLADRNRQQVSLASYADPKPTIFQFTIKIDLLTFIHYWKIFFTKFYIYGYNNNRRVFRQIAWHNIYGEFDRK